MRMHFSLVVMVGLLAAACSSPFLDSMRSVVARENGPTANCALRYGYGLSPEHAVTFTFTHAMDRGSLKVGGTMASESKVTWVDAQTLRLSPVSSWSGGDDRTIEATCTDTDGFSSHITRIFSILDGAIYVSPDGTPWNSGTLTQPLQTIEAATTMAETMYPGQPVEIRLAEGVYAPNFTQSGQAIVIRDKQTWKGGYFADFSSRDGGLHPSTIDARAAIGESQVAVVIADATEGVTIDGIGIRSPTGDDSACLLVKASRSVNLTNLALENSASGGFPLVISACEEVTLEGTNLSSSYPVTALVLVEQSQRTTLRSSRFEALSSQESAGLYIDQSEETLLEGNVLRMGLGPQYPVETSVGLWFVGCDPVVRNNIIDAGSGRHRVALRNVGASPQVFNNTCYAGTNTVDLMDTLVPCLVENNTDAVGNASRPTLINNLFLSGGMVSGEFIEGGSSAEVHHNSFSFFSSNFLQGFNSYLLSPFKTENDIRDDLWYWLTKPEWKLTSTAPAVLRSQGADLSSYGFSTDFGGRPRAAGAWSRGAWQ